MGGSTNTVLHLLAVAQEAGVDFTIKDIDALSRKTPCLCKLAPNTQKYSVQECNRAGGILGIMHELSKGGLIEKSAPRVDGMTIGEAMDKYCITDGRVDYDANRIYQSAPGNRFSTKMGSQSEEWGTLDTDRANGCIRDIAHAYTKDGGLAVLFGNIAQDGCVVKTAGVDALRRSCRLLRFAGRCLRRHSGRTREEGRLRGDYPRRSQGRSRYAGNAVSHLLY